MTEARAKRAWLIALFGGAALLSAALGIWQVERLAWKRDLIARVNARVHAPAVAPPARATWATLDPVAFEYRRVVATGPYRHDRETRVDALTKLGAGDWLITPLATADGPILINRGFVPRGAAAIDRPAGPVTVRGLIRRTEPRGRFLRPNQPAEDRWFSRDVAAIAQARHLAGAAPFFIDAEASPKTAGYPVGGLTVVTFRNAHLIYALTWFSLALLSSIALGFLVREKTRGRPTPEL